MITDQQEHNKAAAFFTTVLTVCAGFAGLAVAGIVLGFDYFLHGEPHERDHLAARRKQRSRDRAADAFAWLDNDRAERERFRAARRAWFEADPNTRGDRPAGEETFGRVAGRAWNNLIAGGHRFASGWRQGRDTAQARRDAGDPNWWRKSNEPTRLAPEGDRADADATPPPAAPEPTAGPAGNPTTPDASEIIDAEIIPDVEPTTRDVVPVGQDPDPSGPDPKLAEYQQRLDELAGEVHQNSNGQPATPAIH